MHEQKQRELERVTQWTRHHVSDCSGWSYLQHLLISTNEDLDAALNAFKPMLELYSEHDVMVHHLYFLLKHGNMNWKTWLSSLPPILHETLEQRLNHSFLANVSATINGKQILASQ
jgi:hypothetical protein